MIVVAGISWAVVLGQVCGIVSNLDSEEQVFRSRMDELNTMMEDRVIDPEVRTRLRSFFLSNKTAQRRARQKHIIASMSPGLRGEVALEINRRWMMKVSLLKHIIDGCSSPKKGPFYTAFLVEVSLKLTTCIYAQSETFGMNHTLCILLRGLVAQNDRIRPFGASTFAYGSEADIERGLFCHDVRRDDDPGAKCLHEVGGKARPRLSGIEEVHPKDDLLVSVPTSHLVGSRTQASRLEPQFPRAASTQDRHAHLYTEIEPNGMARRSS
eukprot:CAMPEP_0206424720 /NCGR_PEP_ID=MMETSP0324_2-20121206/3392_1 /ASSEMBLY_ACC=CAM_ASM_000836 /TAXON_ID=2866 /ORGANISM="Crypthecodinium cohnii, Strain Seligo" /LENGTH=267 /DNA_ID=CAMNT_0053889421 /DNA_START=97 /DNA_END=901 /DNA_ORIENTATION=-